MAPWYIPGVSAAESAFAAAAARFLASGSERGGGSWLEESLASLEPELRAIRIAWARAPRKLGRDLLNLDAAGATSHGLPELVASGDWTRFDLGRMAILFKGLADLPPPEHAPLISRLLKSGEIGEQESLLKGLCLLPEPERFVGAAVEACRTNAASVFEAIAAENPYPAAHFPELAFNQMVLKGVFMGMSARRIVGLETRATAELSRMAEGYASERRAADRSVPDDIEFIVSLPPQSQSTSPQ